MRDRLALPFLLPLLIAGGILLTIFSFGYVLLQASHTSVMIARSIAIAAGVLVLLVASVLANRPKLSGWPVYAATALPAAIVLAAGVFYLVRPGEKAATEAQAAAIAPPGPLTQTATDNRFSETSYTIIAGQEYTLNFANQGAALHNWSLKGVTGAGGAAIQTKLLTGGQTETITFTVPQAGSFEFICDVHPVDMVGRITAVAESEATAGAATGGAPAAGTSPGPTKIVNVATDNKFALTTLSANANEATTLTLENKGSAIHNLAIKGVTSTDGKAISTPLAPGGKTETITFTIAQPGTYDFICDVHPVDMKGKITVQ